MLNRESCDFFPLNREKGNHLLETISRIFKGFKKALVKMDSSSIDIH